MANLTRYGTFDNLFDDLARGFWVTPLAAPGGEELRLKVEVKEDDKAYTVHAEIPGVKKEDIQVEVHGDQVSIRDEGNVQGWRAGSDAAQEVGRRGASRRGAMTGP
jgi:HSP20 family protein